MRYIVLSILISFVTACGSTPITNYYILTPIENGIYPHEVASMVGRQTLGVGPVSFPDHLKRSQIVTHKSKQHVNIAKFDRWAGKFEKNFTHVLTENLAVLLLKQNVVEYPWKNSDNVSQHIMVDVIHFGEVADGNTVLKVRWRIVDSNEKQPLYIKTSSYVNTPKSSEYAGITASMSENLSHLSQDIASRVNHMKNLRGKVSN